MLVTCDNNERLKALSDLIVDSVGLFQYIEEYALLRVLLETPSGFKWTDIEDCVRFGAEENGTVFSIVEN